MAWEGVSDVSVMAILTNATVSYSRRRESSLSDAARVILANAEFCGLPSERLPPLDDLIEEASR